MKNFKYRQTEYKQMQATTCRLDVTNINVHQWAQSQSTSIQYTFSEPILLQSSLMLYSHTLDLQTDVFHEVSHQNLVCISSFPI